MKTELLHAFIEQVWNRGEIDSIPDYIGSSYTIYHDPGDPWEGQTLDAKGLQERVSISRAPVPDQRFDIQRSFEDERGVCITWLWQGTHLGELAGFPPSGRTLTMSGATVYSFTNDLISGHWQIADRLGVFQQLHGG